MTKEDLQTILSLLTQTANYGEFKREAIRSITSQLQQISLTENLSSSFAASQAPDDDEDDGSPNERLNP
jgi:two-component sensor histidine kinase